MAKKLTRIELELERYGIFTGTFHPDTAPPNKQTKIATVIQRILMDISKTRDPHLVNILRKQIQKAEAGDVRAASFLFDRAFGMPRQTVENIGSPVTELKIEIINPK